MSAIDTSWLSLAGTIAVPAISLLASTIVASLSYYFSRKKQIEEEQRKVKAGVYEGFYASLVSVAQAQTVENQKALSQYYNRLLFTGSDSVVKTAIAWWTEIASQGNRGDINSPTLKLLIDRMRRDLGISRRSVISKSTFAPIGLKANAP